MCKTRTFSGVLFLDFFSVPVPVAFFLTSSTRALFFASGAFDGSRLLAFFKVAGSVESGGALVEASGSGAGAVSSSALMAGGVSVFCLVRF